MKNITLTVQIILSLSYIAFAQAPNIDWQNTIGGSENDFLHSIQQTADDGYILGGTSESPNDGEKTDDSIGEDDYWVIKLNSNGEIQWQNTIGGSEDDNFRSIQQTKDGGYIMGGYSESPADNDKSEDSQGYNDYWVVKLDENGDYVWDKTIGGSEEDRLEIIQQTADGGYILGGYSDSDADGDKDDDHKGSYDYWIVKLSSNGQKIEWQNTIGGGSTDRLHSIQQTADKGFILGGYSASDISDDKSEANQGSYDYWVVKLDENGDYVWDKTFGGSDSDKLRSIQQTDDLGYILGGYSYSDKSGDKTDDSWGENDYWVVKIDKDGDYEWDKTIGGSDKDYLYSIQQTKDGGYILGGYSESPDDGDKTEANQGWYDYWVVKLYPDGSIYWDKTIGGSRDDELYLFQQTTDGGYILGGSSDSPDDGNKTEVRQGEFDYWVMKLTPDVALPVELSSFTVTGSDQGVVSNWTTESEIENLGFLLDRRTKDTDWIEIASYKTNDNLLGQGTTSSYTDYEYIDKFVQPNSTYEYRLADVDYNGIVTYHATRSVTVENASFALKVGKFTVLPSYPNPFNPSTTIRYNIPNNVIASGAKQSHVYIAIYNISGKLVTTLVNKEQSAGWHAINWNGTNNLGEQVPAGIYLSKITSGSKVQTTKLMLLR